MEHKIICKAGWELIVYDDQHLVTKQIKKQLKCFNGTISWNAEKKIHTMEGFKLEDVWFEVRHVIYEECMLILETFRCYR